MSAAAGHSSYPDLNTSPKLECDIIMKGGVTSGVVYPPAILELAREFRFCSVGGASAGAIAAAATAAAEYGRQAQPVKDGSGFVRLEGLEKELSENGFLLQRFQVTGERKALLDTFLGLRNLRKLHTKGQAALARASPPLGRLQVWVQSVDWWIPRLSGLLRDLVSPAYRQGALFGFLLALLLALGPLWAGLDRFFTGVPLHKVMALPLLFLGAGLLWLGYVAGGLGGGFWELGQRLMRLQDKRTGMYGICSGSAGQDANLQGDSSRLALTDWLHVRLNELAGLKGSDVPVTLKELATRGISFKLVTSNLSLGQPYILPLTRGSRSFFFKEEDLKQLFPPPVVAYLREWGRTNRPRKLRFRKGEEDTFLRFPMGDSMPLVVATRLSLSFPVLLTAVRLYSFTGQAYAKSARTPQREDDPDCTVDLSQDVEEHWFSDGGISSNFPIHIFDAWIPERPTFGITLYDSPLPKVLDQRKLDPAHSVLLPKPSDFDLARPQRTNIQSIFDFLRAIFDTAQSYRDNAQSGLPSYRERIVQVFLQDDEGGLNLDMKTEAIQQIKDKGRRAARELIGRYLTRDATGEPCFSEAFHEHRWVRMHVLMAQLEQEFEQVRAIKMRPSHEHESWKQQLQQRYQALVETQLAQQGKERSWYRAQDEVWCGEALSRVFSLLELVDSWNQAQTPGFQQTGRKRVFSEKPPRPEGKLRVTPDV